VLESPVLFSIFGRVRGGKLLLTQDRRGHSPQSNDPMKKRLRKDLLVAAVILVVVVIGMTVIGLLT
jgi:hypothetical protein